MQPEVLAAKGCEMGECPRWDPDDRRLYWCDMLDGAMYRYDPDHGTAMRIYRGPNVGGFVRERGRTHLLFMEDGSVRRRSRDGSVDVLVEHLPGLPGVRFHDAVVDPRGRVLCGTIPTEDAASGVYRLDTDGTVAELVTDVDVANGIGFSPAGDRLYLADTGRDRVDAFTYDQDSGGVSDRECFVAVDGAGSPDGLAVDESGHVWLAVTGGSRMVRHAPDGTLDRTVSFPVPTVTSVEFGGPDRCRAYVTTGTDQEAADPAPMAGALFGFDVETPGLARTDAAVSL